MASPAQKPNKDDGRLEEQRGSHAPGAGPSNIQHPSTTSPGIPKRSSTNPFSPNFSTASSTANSPRPSREGSPTRPSLKSGHSTGGLLTRSRNNSQDLSPIRAPGAPGSNIPTIPSAAAIQRALSAAGTPHLASPAKQDSSNDQPQPQKSTKALTGASGLKIPRINSPPPAASSGSNKSVLSSSRKIDQSQSIPTPPSIVVDSPARSSSLASTSDSDVGDEEQRIQKPGMRTPVRGSSGNGPALETVQEASLPSTPALGAARSGPTNKPTSNDPPQRIEENPMEDASGGKGLQSRPESGSESAGKKSVVGKSKEELAKETKKPPAVANSSKPAAVSSKRSFTQLPFTKAPKTAAEGSIKSMTVETETVSSIPQVAVAGGPTERTLLRRSDTSTSLRARLSTETIRPRKEKKKVARKAPSLNAGNGGSIFNRFSRPLFFRSMTSLPFPTPEEAHEDEFEREKEPNTLLPGNSTDQLSPLSRRTSNPERPRGPPRSLSISVLIPSRGRIASTKADIFEQKIATAVDEANSSDSEETFVYESNPPEPLSARAHRFHSRTPSATSTASHYDSHGPKGRQDSHHSVVPKKSMKFANNYNSIGYSNGNDSTIRGASQRTAGSNAPHHHHIGRYGWGGHPSLFDSDSPFSTTTKQTQSTAGHLSRSSPRHSSGRNQHVVHVTKNPRKTEDIMSYDLEGEGADDERTPLIGSNRTARNRRRPLPGSVRQMYSDDKDSRICRRVTAWTSFAIVITTVLAAILAVIIMCSKPLANVYVKDIRNVLASEQELIFDLHVHAVNPNFMAIQVSELDISVFAHSKYVGTNEQWRSHQPHHDSPYPLEPGKLQIDSPNPGSSIDDPSDVTTHPDGVDEGTDPIDDPMVDSPFMLIGRILEFETPLIFEASPFRHHSFGSVGEVRLAKPGNKTEEGGSRRWERVVQHDFVLRTAGRMQYSPPISSNLYKSKLEARVVVYPTEDIDEPGNMSTIEPRSDASVRTPRKKRRPWR